MKEILVFLVGNDADDGQPRPIGSGFSHLDVPADGFLVGKILANQRFIYDRNSLALLPDRGPRTGVLVRAEHPWPENRLV